MHATATIEVLGNDQPGANGLRGRLGPCTTQHLVTTASGRQVVVWRTDPLLPGHRHKHPVIVTPGFARPMADMAGVALGLAVNGLTTYRFDTLDHVGLSDGSIRNFTMAASIESLEAVSAFVRHQAGADPAYLATSLSARYVVRHAAGRSDVHAIALAVGVLNVRRTLELVFGIDFTTGGIDSLPSTVEFDRQHIDPRPLWHDNVRNDWLSFPGTVADLAAIRAPITGIYAARDPWVDITDIRKAFSPARNLRLVELPTDDHELFSNPVHGAAALTTAAAALIGRSTKPARLLTPPPNIARQAIDLERTVVEVAGR